MIGESEEWGATSPCPPNSQGAPFLDIRSMEGGNSGEVLSEDQGMEGLCPFERVGGFRVPERAAD